MEINGVIIVTPLMSEMEVGQSGYLTTDAIVVVNKSKLFIAIGYSISEIKSEKYRIPITRTGPGKEDYKIDFNITALFYNSYLNEEEFQAAAESNKFIGPYNVQTEIYRPLEYCEQQYPRMDLLELIKEFGEVKNTLLEIPDDKKAQEDIKELRKFLKMKFMELSLKELRLYEISFDPLSEEMSEGGEIINYIEDKKMSQFIHKLIEDLEEHIELQDLPVDELEKRKKTATDNSNFELAGKIHNIIIKKTSTV